MNTSKFLLPAVLAVALTGGAMVADGQAAQPGKAPQQGMVMGPDGCCPMMRGNVAMTPEKRAQFVALKKEHDAKVQPLKDQLFIKKHVLRAQENASTPDVKAVTDTATEIAALHNKIRAEKEAFYARVEKEVGIPCQFFMKGHPGPHGDHDMPMRGPRHDGMGPHGDGMGPHR